MGYVCHMSRRAPRARGPRALGVGAVVASALLAGSLAPPVSRAQPAPTSKLDRAKDLYQSAEAAMKDGQFDDAMRDYGAAYELSKDPALLFKIGRANEKAGKCEIALTYYARYLHEGTPNEKFATMTRERIAACGGDVHKVEGSAGAAEPQPGASSGHGSNAAPTPAGSQPAAGAGHAAGSAADSVEVAAGTGPGTGSAPPALTPSRSHKAAWILTGGVIALATLGGVLAYAANSSENDIRDLYVGFAGQPATFDTRTKQRYDDLVDQGHRYEHLSWASFGLAGAAAAGAAVLFVLGRREEPAQPARITPIVTTNSAGLAVRF